MVRKLFTWACPLRVTAKNEIISGGCGGNWGPALPERCPRCGGPLVLLQTLSEIPLQGSPE